MACCIFELCEKLQNSPNIRKKILFSEGWCGRLGQTQVLRKKNPKKYSLLESLVVLQHTVALIICFAQLLGQNLQEVGGDRGRKG